MNLNHHRPAGELPPTAVRVGKDGTLCTVSAEDVADILNLLTQISKVPQASMTKGQALRVARQLAAQNHLLVKRITELETLAEHMGKHLLEIGQ